MRDTFDTATAAGRLRILWNATADPQLAMSDDEVADVATVLDEHAAMADELKLTRAERDDAQRRFDALVTSDKAKQGAADWMLNRLHGDRLIDDDTYSSLCGLLRDQIDATRSMTHSEDWGPLTDRFRAAVKHRKAAEAERDEMRELLGSIWLYVSWRQVTKPLTTEQKELWADAVDADVMAAQAADGEEPRPVADRWWRDDA